VGNDENEECVLTTISMAEAVLAAARLQDRDIPVRIQQEAASSAIPVSVGILGEIDVLVPASMLEQALAVLEAAEPATPDDAAEDEE
jgi:hypothetical protein